MKKRYSKLTKLIFQSVSRRAKIAAAFFFLKYKRALSSKNSILFRKHKEVLDKFFTLCYNPYDFIVNFGD